MSFKHPHFPFFCSVEQKKVCKKRTPYFTFRNLTLSIESIFFGLGCFMADTSVQHTPILRKRYIQPGSFSCKTNFHIDGTSLQRTPSRRTTCLNFQYIIRQGNPKANELQQVRLTNFYLYLNTREKIRFYSKII